MWIDIKDKSKWPSKVTLAIFRSLREDGSIMFANGRLSAEDGLDWCDCCTNIHDKGEITHWVPIPQLEGQE